MAKFQCKRRRRFDVESLMINGFAYDSYRIEE